MTNKSQRAIPVRPERHAPEELMAPIQKNIGDLEAEPGKDDEAVREQGGTMREADDWQGVPDGCGGDRVVDTHARPVWKRCGVKLRT